MTYADFLARKRRQHLPQGFEPSALSKYLKDFQRHIVQWAVRRGRAAIFADCGLGKTLMQLEWARQVHERTQRPVLILTPLAVSGQTLAEGEKFGIPAWRADNAAGVVNGINITNYERLHKFDASVFGGVVLDESSILKSFTGATKRALLEAFSQTPYRLACTATPSPNDYMELGNHSEFLGVMDSSEMLSRWFLNDTMKAGGYRLKGHAEADFWRWCSSWSVCIDKPSDLGFSDEGYVLPPLRMHQVVVPVDQTIAAGEGRLFRQADLSATSIHSEMRLTAPHRAAAVARLVQDSPDVPWLLWCNTNYESAEITSRIPHCVEVSGSTPEKEREDYLLGFADGSYDRLVTKPSIGGFGMNWQHCGTAAFVGLSYSFEQLYQAIRRNWRFGRTGPVDAYLVLAETEGPVLERVEEKRRNHERMRAAMIEAIKHESVRVDGLVAYQATKKLEVPTWLA